MPRGYAIQIPQQLTEKLQGHGHNRLVEVILSSFSDWLARNETVFFRDYTDHGTRHIEDVLETACGLISAPAFEFFSAEDATALICSAILHDSALHPQEPSFLALVNDDPSWRNSPGSDDVSWAIAWKQYVSEASRLSRIQLKELFGTDTPVTPPDLRDTSTWTPIQYHYIGEFLRRHHPRIAQQIAYSGIPGAKGSSPLEAITPDDPLLPFIHLLGTHPARSHGMNLRDTFDALEKGYHLRKHGNCHPVYVMGLLRLADYLQLQIYRAPQGVLRVKGIRSPKSRRRMVSA